MKVSIIQPPYGFTAELTHKTVKFIIRQLEECNTDTDLILTPEYSNTPGSLTESECIAFANHYAQQLEDAAISAAVRCHAIVALSYCAPIDGKYFNLTRLISPTGNFVGEYLKQQLVLSEPTTHHVENSYALIPRNPTILEINNIRFGFVICYDAYFNEYIANIARYGLDVILVSAMQRAETCENLRLMNQMLAFQTNAFVCRSSYSMGSDSEYGGTSLVVAPSGKILADMYQQTGLLCCDIGDVKQKYFRSNSFGGSLIANHKFIEQGRTPWAYRPCGPFVCLDNKRMPYPRVCAYRGFHFGLPENSLPAFAAAIALGVDEIALDLWETADGIPVVMSDCFLEHFSNGTGIVSEKTLSELQKLDFGVGFSPLPKLNVTTFEDVMKRFSRHVVMNIHIHSPQNITSPRPLISRTASILNDYDCTDYAYFTGSEQILTAALEVAPDIPRCLSITSHFKHFDFMECAIRLKCQKIQFSLENIAGQNIENAHKHGIICNLYLPDEIQNALSIFQMGIDTILTDNCQALLNVRNEFFIDHEHEPQQVE